MSKAKYLVRCTRCNQTIDANVIPWRAGACHFCWLPGTEAIELWGSWWQSAYHDLRRAKRDARLTDVPAHEVERKYLGIAARAHRDNYDRDIINEIIAGAEKAYFYGPDFDHFKEWRVSIKAKLLALAEKNARAFAADVKGVRREPDAVMQLQINLFERFSK